MLYGRSARGAPGDGVTVGPLIGVLEVDCPTAAGSGSLHGCSPGRPGSGLPVSSLGSISLEIAGAVSISAEPEVPRRMGEGGANNNSHSVLGL